MVERGMAKFEIAREGRCGFGQGVGDGISCEWVLRGRGGGTVGYERKLGGNRETSVKLICHAGRTRTPRNHQRSDERIPRFKPSSSGCLSWSEKDGERDCAHVSRLVSGGPGLHGMGESNDRFVYLADASDSMDQMEPVPVCLYASSNPEPSLTI